jgi:hypothetical protein
MGDKPPINLTKMVVFSKECQFLWVIRFTLGLSDSVLVLVIERNGRRDERRAEDQTGAIGFELTRMAMNYENSTELESGQALSSEHDYEHCLWLSTELK